MKKFTRVCIVIAIVSCILGILFVAIGALTGGMSVFLQAVERGEFSYRFGNDSNPSNSIFTYVYKVEEGREGYSYELDEVQELSLDIVGTAVYIHDSYTDDIIVEATPIDYTNVTLVDGELHIETDYEDHVMRRSVFSFLGKTTPLQIDIYIPFQKGFTLEELEASVTGGVLYIEEMQTADMDIELVGGEVEIAGDITGEANIEVVAGNLEIVTDRGIESYNYILEGAASNIKIGDKSKSVLAEDSKIMYHEKTGSIFYIECSAGSVEIIEN